MTSQDNAMKIEQSLKVRGGIDLSSDKVLTVQNNGQGIQFHIDPAMSANSYWRDLATSGGLQELENAPGFYPNVISIEPLDSLPKFLGII